MGTISRATASRNHNAGDQANATNSHQNLFRKFDFFYGKRRVQ